MWDAQIADLSTGFRILRYDHRGHGKSGTPTQPYSLADLGGDVLALLVSLGIERTHFCGLSIGGLTAQWLGIHAGNRLDRVVTCATAAQIRTPEGWRDRIGEVKANGLDSLVAAIADRWFTPGFHVSRPTVVDEILNCFQPSAPCSEAALSEIVALVGSWSAATTG